MTFNRNHPADYPRTVFLAGAARSGSTLIGEVLGAQARTLNVGELSLFWRDAARGNRCACGSPIPECPLWSDALRQALPGPELSPSTLESLAATRARLARTSRPQELLRLRRTPREEWPDDVQRLVTATTNLVAAAANLTGADVIVDASKTLSALLFLDLCGAQYDIVHVVRRPTAVVASTLRSREVARGNPDSKPPGGSLVTGVLRWSWSNLCALQSRRMSKPRTYSRAHYEDFTANPAAVTASLCKTVALAQGHNVIQGHRVTLPKTSHAAVGNPRRGASTFEVSEDDRWRTELSGPQVRMIDLATAPLRWVL